jgi:hypothetical protein
VRGLVEVLAMAFAEALLYEDPVRLPAADDAQNAGHLEQVRVVPTKIGSMPTVDVVLGATHEPGAYRIQVNVSHELEKIAVAIADDGPVASLKEMPDLRVRPVEGLRV